MDRSPRATATTTLFGAVADPCPEDRVLLDSTVRLARSAFCGAASSILLLEPDAKHLLFAAVSGRGEDFLVGQRFAADRGLAGWVAASGEAMIVDDLAASELFARDIAESTGYVPNAIMVAPLLGDNEVMGVLEVLDPQRRSESGLADLELLTAIGQQTEHSLHCLMRGKNAEAALAAERIEFERLAGLVALLTSAPAERRAAGVQLIESLEHLLTCLSTNGETRGR
jgi:GAF domain-containing protein